MGIIEDVKANLARLDGCAGPHRLALVPDPKREAQGLSLLGRKYFCSTCGGTMDAAAALWYARGLRAGAIFENEAEVMRFLPEELRR